MVVENDFAGYGYANLLTALEVVVSHENFHAVQAAYRGDFPTWVSGGTAVWAEKRFDENSADYLALARNYLEEPSRSLYNPPTGPVPAFAYGTALFLGLPNNPAQSSPPQKRYSKIPPSLLNSLIKIGWRI